MRLDIKKITGIAYNSSKVKKGYCFVAIKGVRSDGHRFIGDAISRGASVIVSERKVRTPGSVINIVVPDPRKALSNISADYFANPSEKLRVTGITGTNGKTTVTYLLEAILKKAGLNPGVIGTVNWRHNDECLLAPNTTPESYELQSLIKRMVSKGVTDLVMEVSSHAIEQKRAEDVEFSAAVFTNLTHDHLDYHGSIKKYFETKLKLFTELLPASCKKKKWAIINCDDGYGRKIVQACRRAGVQACRRVGVQALTYGFDSKADVRVRKWHGTVEGNEMIIDTPWGGLKCFSRLKGKFNVSNVLAAVACAGAYGIPLKKIKHGIESLKNVPGRLEEVPNKKGVSVFVDYAHTPDALKNVLTTLAAVASGRLITVFGCGGDRDKKKRPVMGRTASQLSDVVVVTSDNPRSEVPAKIIKDILKGINGNGCVIEEDRKLAIKKAISMARKGDVVVIAGKGHEDYQIIGDKKIKFDDKAEVRKCLNA